jgi:hypothetical protein
MGTSSLQIDYTACGEETLVRREPIYEGFSKVGEQFVCTGCGHVYADEADVPFRDISGPSIFTAADRSKKIKIFHSDEANRNCRHCRHYLVNPFVQKCGLHGREVQATDLCDDFAPPPPKSETEDPLAKLLKKGRE